MTAMMSLSAINAGPPAMKQHREGGSSTAAREISSLTVAPKGYHRLQPRATPGFKTGRLRAPLTYTGAPFPAFTGKPKASRANAAQGLPNLVGSVIHNDTWTVSDSYDGLYSIGYGTTSMLFKYNSLTANGGGIEVDGIYYVTHSYEFWDMLFVDVAGYSMTDGSEKFIYFGANDNIAIDMATDPTTGIIYGITNNADLTGYQLAKMTYTDKAVTTTAIAPLEGNWNALACDATGQLYGISFEGTGEGDAFTVTSSRLCKIDKATGAVTVVGVTGQLPQYQSSATIDEETGRMFWNVCPPDGSGLLCEVNLATGEATQLCVFANNDEITGMYVSRASADDKAPGEVTNLTANFEKGSLTGTISFSAPTTTFDGQEISGNLLYDITANGELIASGRTVYGGSVDKEVTVSAPGEYLIAVTVKNDVAKSPAAKLTLFIGNGAPAAPEVKLAYAGGVMTLTWKAVETAVDGGYINPAEITYTVTRYPGNVKVAENISATSFSESIEEPMSITEYYYVVVANNGNVTSAEAKSNTVSLGSLIPPYSNTFDLPTSLAGFTTIDGNGDEKTWTYDDHSVRIFYNTAKDMDDWFITPSIYLEKGKTYTVSFNTWCYSPSSPERIEAKWGNAATVDGLSNMLVEPTVVAVRNDAPLSLSGTITPSESGKYYVGIHGISDADRFYLNIDNLSISEGVAVQVPSAPTNLKAVADPDGELKAVVSLKAPEVDAVGDPIKSISDIVVKRGNEIAMTFENPSPGEELSFTDNVATMGNVTYTAIASNAAGQGIEASVTVFIGIDTPADPANVTIAETTNQGEVEITWAPITTDWKGNPINPDKVTYYVARNNGLTWEPVTDKSSDTRRVFRAVDEGKQDFVQYAVFAETPGGASVTLTEQKCVGTPYNGFNESFPGGTSSCVWAIGFTDGSAEWSISDDNSYAEIKAQDADNGFVTMEAYEINATSALISGKVNLEGLTSPMACFYTYNMVGTSGESDNNEIDIYARELPADSWTILSHSVVHEIGDGALGWKQVLVDLSPVAGKTVQLRFQAKGVNYVCTAIDNIKVGDIPQYDVAAGTINAPSTVACGTSYNVSVDVINNGVNPLNGVKVELYADDELVATETVDAIANGNTITVNFPREMDILSTGIVNYHAVVAHEKDMVLTNNKTARCTVEPVLSKLPAATSLSGNVTADGIELTWQAPDLSNAPGEASTVDFENGEAFAKEYGDWIFVDGDKVPVGAFQGLTIPGITIGETCASFFLFDSSLDAFAKNSTFDAHSGSKYLAALFRADDGTVDDWAISPMLDGYAQDISFYAKSYDEQYPEKIELYYSTGSVDTKEFIKVGAIEKVPGNWTEYHFEVPDGARYFAIRSCAKGSFMLMLDDFKYAAAESSSRLTLNGYDLYRDGVKINDALITDTRHVDSNVELGNHTYVVIAVYTVGMSAPSEAFVVNYSGIEAINPSSTSISGGQGAIAVNGADGMRVRVAGVDGKIIFNGEGCDKMSIPAFRGLYIVTAGDTTAKVIVN